MTYGVKPKLSGGETMRKGEERRIFAISIDFLVTAKCKGVPPLLLLSFNFAIYYYC